MTIEALAFLSRCVKCVNMLWTSLNKIDLHKSLHGCCIKRGTGTAAIEAKLAQQLAHLEQVPSYGVFLHLKRLMDRECCLLILEGY